MHVTVGLPQMEKVAYDAIHSIASCRTCGKWVLPIQFEEDTWNLKKRHIQLVWVCLLIVLLQSFFDYLPSLDVEDTEKPMAILKYNILPFFL